MASNKETTYCRVCGLDQEEYPWGEDGRCPTYMICQCCGAEFGYHDCTLIGIRRQREIWLAKKGEWHRPKEKPENWSLEERMKNIPNEYL